MWLLTPHPIFNHVTGGSWLHSSPMLAVQTASFSTTWSTPSRIIAEHRYQHRMGRVTLHVCFAFLMGFVIVNN
jgi:hypothetical protein